ncbi:MAG: hypothetical protein ACON5G_05160 [Pirellulaceae bacterium]
MPSTPSRVYLILTILSSRRV